MNAAQGFYRPNGHLGLDMAGEISVPKKFQTTREKISELLKGFEENCTQPGFLIYR